MGIFGRKKSKLKTKPVPGRDDLVAVEWESLREAVVPDCEAIHSRFEQDIDDRVLTVLSIGGLNVGRWEGLSMDSQIFFTTAARFGYFCRDTEIDRQGAALNSDEAETVEMLYRQASEEFDDGYMGSANGALKIASFPFDPEVPADIAIPGWNPPIREAISEVILGALVYSETQNGNGELAPSMDALKQVFGFGYMVHLWQELDNPFWLDGIKDD